MGEIKNIIFDLGGVLLDIDYNKTADAFKKLGYTDFDAMYSQFTADQLFTRLETGKISEDDFYAALIQRSSGEMTSGKIAAAWNKMLLVWRESSLHFLKSLADNYNLYLLSNTNTIHLTAFGQILKEQMGEDRIDGLFTKAYYSNEVGLRKPGKEIFEFVLKDAGIIAADTLFIDDSENNIETARQLGFKTHFLRGNERIEDLPYASF